MELEKSAFPVSRGGGPKGVGCSDGFPIPQDSPLKTFHFTFVKDDFRNENRGAPFKRFSTRSGFLKNAEV
jgi:hypothetical protein